ncbi:ABC transporter substrate-binding protein [Enterococcus devriesei]|uniref:ABC transporter substrate-binding protein n=1 Tax=Enterococcus devriesei TaxID=319970 RepID=UPI0028902844|nr:ABC transporter substrate-binding protein [Enterococcus devriesei]MDT2822990.1 ABC transporter substrate-binding protein [Enterococcus devriesei]
MKVWKKVVLSTIALFSLGGLAACGNGEDEKKASDTTISMFLSKVEYKKEMEAFVKKFEEKNPDISIDLTFVGGGEDSESSLKAKFSSGEAPTVFMAAGLEQFVNYKQYAADVSDTESIKNAIPSTIESMKLDDGGIGAVPMSMEVYSYLYNKKIFKDAGIDAETIKTQNDLTEAVKKIDKQKSKLGLDAVFAFPAKETWSTGMHGGGVFVAPEFDYDPTIAVSAPKFNFDYADQLKYYVDIQNDYGVQPAVSMDYSTQIDDKFIGEKVAVVMQGSWVVPTLVEANEEWAQENIGILPIPVDGTPERYLDGGCLNYYIVNKEASKKEIKAAKKFLDYMNCSDEGKKNTVENFMFIPAYQGYEDYASDVNLIKEYTKYVNEDTYRQSVFNATNVDWLKNSIGTGIQEYITDDASWDEVVSDVKDAWKPAEEK